LTARPVPAASDTAAGKIALADGAVAYIPASRGSGSRPLIVLLHGAGGRAGTFLDRFTGLADRERIILLAVQSRGATWDLAAMRDARSGGPLAIKVQARLRFGPDVERVDAALANLFSRAAVDPRRIVLMGFSDGASYALSLGLANPQLFSAIIALSPGFVVVPAQLSPAQRIFIAHGKSDSVLPFSVAEHDIFGLLIGNRLKPRFRPFAGDHRIDEAALAEGIAYALGSARPAPGL
jgi:predicted esterase